MDDRSRNADPMNCSRVRDKGAMIATECLKPPSCEGNTCHFSGRKMHYRDRVFVVASLSEILLPRASRQNTSRVRVSTSQGLVPYWYCVMCFCIQVSQCFERAAKEHRTCCIAKSQVTLLRHGCSLGGAARDAGIEGEDAAAVTWCRWCPARTALCQHAFYLVRWEVLAVDADHRQPSLWYVKLNQVVLLN